MAQGFPRIVPEPAGPHADAAGGEGAAAVSELGNAAWRNLDGKAICSGSLHLRCRKAIYVLELEGIALHWAPSQNLVISMEKVR